jgi:antitoxin (DNA-binding transcriptional repressor) of toxin-antitoxin stability system
LVDVKAVAVKELKNRFSSYLRDVREGEVVLVTDRGRVIAELRQPSSGTPLTGHDRALERLSAEGVLVPGLPQDPRAYRPSPLRRPVVSADLLDAERGSR